jgi:hypothetical protein
MAKRCASKPPWNRIEGLTGNWRYEFLLWMPPAAAGLALVAAVARAFKRRAARAIALTSLWTTATLTLSFILIWGTGSIW